MTRRFCARVVSFCRWICVTACIGVAVLSLGPAVADETTGPPPAGNQADAAIREALNKPIDLDLNEASLRELAEAIHNHAKIDVLVDRKAIEDAAIDADAKVTIQLHKRPLRQSLDLALNPLELQAVVAPGALLITTKEKEAARLSVRAYPIGDLKTQPKQSIFGRSNSYGEIIDLVTTVVQPNTWDDVGGPGGISQFGSVLTIRQTDEVHQQIVELLTYIRRVRDAQAAGDAADSIEFPERTAERKLFDQRVSFDFDETALSNVLDALRRMCDCDIVLDTKALEDAAIDNEATVTLNVHDMRLKDALHHLLQPLELTAIVKDGVLLVTTREKCAAELTTQIYSVADLVDFESTRSDERRDKLLGLITSTLQPNTWDDVGGPGSIFTFAPARCVVISQTAEVHDEIHNLLQQLRSVRETGEETEDERDENEFVLRIYQPVIGSNGVVSTGVVQSDNKAKHQEPDATVEQVIQALQSLVEPDSWHNEGASVRPIGKYLFVRQTTAIHEGVAELLEKLGYKPVPASGGALYPATVGTGSAWPM